MVADYVVLLNNICKICRNNVSLRKKRLSQGAFAQPVVILSLFQRYASSRPSNKSLCCCFLWKCVGWFVHLVFVVCVCGVYEFCSLALDASIESQFTKSTYESVLYYEHVLTKHPHRIGWHGKPIRHPDDDGARTMCVCVRDVVGVFFIIINCKVKLACFNPLKNLCPSSHKLGTLETRGCSHDLVEELSSQFFHKDVWIWIKSRLAVYHRKYILQTCGKSQLVCRRAFR